MGCLAGGALVLNKRRDKEMLIKFFGEEDYRDNIELNDGCRFKVFHRLTKQSYCFIDHFCKYHYRGCDADPVFLDDWDDPRDFPKWRGVRG